MHVLTPGVFVNSLPPFEEVISENTGSESGSQQVKKTYYPIEIWLGDHSHVIGSTDAKANL